MLDASRKLPRDENLCKCGCCGVLEETYQHSFFSYRWGNRIRCWLKHIFYGNTNFISL